jgi:PKD domain/Matrixin
MTLPRSLARFRWNVRAGRRTSSEMNRLSRPGLEALEDRVCPITAGTWQPLAASGSGPSFMQALALLSDGTVMVQAGNNGPSNTWYLLTPGQTGNTFPGTATNTGNYVNSAWSALASSGGSISPAEQQLFNTSALLPSGNVFSIGGEYSSPEPFTALSEIFTPSTTGGPGSWAGTATIPTPGTTVRFNSTVITGASNTSPITITAKDTTGLVNNEQLFISGVGGNTAANGGLFTITNVTPTTFQLVGTTGNGNYTSGGNFFVPQFGDDPIEVLPGGNILAGYFNGPQTYIYNPTTNIWTQTAGSKLRNDQSDEETWLKLPDGSILSYDVFGSVNAGVFKAQRYVPSQDKWVDASNLSPTNPPGLLSDGSPAPSAAFPSPGFLEGAELGPAFLLPNGNAIFFGGNGKTAIYDPTTDTWSAGPNQPTRNVGSTISGATNLSGTITGVTGNNVSPIVITTNSTAGLNANDFITISGVTGNTAANGNWTVSNITSTTFQLNPVASGQSNTGNGNYSGGGTWADAVRITTPNTTGLSNGQLVNISGVGGNTAANGSWTIVNKTGTTFQLVGPVGNAAYTSGGNWSSSQLSMDDAPGSIMPNGDILLCFSPLGGIGVDGGYTFPAPSYIYEFDPTTGQYLDVTPGGSISDNQDFLFMIALPSGQVLLDNQAGPGGIQIYSPVGQPQNAWRPTITKNIDTGTTDGSGREIYQMIGTQLTGISEGASFGDEATMATNYPIIQLTDSGGKVYYARTSNWSSTGVQVTGPETVQFTLPSGKTFSDFTSIIVSANGIPSNSIPFVIAPNLTPPADQSSNEGASQTFSLGSFIDPNAGPWSVDVNWNDGTPDTTFSMSSPGTIPPKSHTYGEEGTYTVTETVTNSGNGQSDSKTFKVTVNDPAVVQVLPAAGVGAMEGAPFTGKSLAQFTDPGGAEPNSFDPSGTIADHYKVVSIDWGDGTPSDTTSGSIVFSGSPGSTTDPFTVSGDHTYGEEGNYTIQVVIDHEGVDTTLTSTATVSDPPVQGSGVDVSAKEGITFALPVATFIDPGGAEPNPSDPSGTVADHYSASVDFGDGSPPVAGVITYSGAPGSKTGVFTVSASHTFDEEGTTTVKVTINHEGIITPLPASTATIRDNYGLLLLDPTGDQSLMVTGKGAVTVTNTGAIVVDSSSPSAYFLTGQAIVTATEADVGIGGGTAIKGQAVLNLLEPEFNHEAATPDPIALPLPPAPSTHFAAVKYSGSALLTLSPGTYDGGISVTGKGPVTLLPGVYYMNGGGFTVSGQGSVTGAGVLIVNAPHSTSDVISISGQGSVNLTASMTLPAPYTAYDGITLMQSPASNNPISVTGQGGLTMTGTLYAPKALLKIDGNGSVTVSAFFAGHLSLGGVVVAYDTAVTGNGNLTINADPAPPFQLATGSALDVVPAASGVLAARSALRVGRLLVAIEGATAAEQARVADAINGLDAALGSFGVDLVLAGGAEAAEASIRLDIADATDFGGVPAGVLGVTENGDAITLVSGWDWYVGADPAGIAPNQYDFETVVAHELAHAVGLGEGADPSSVLYPYLSSGEARRSLSAGDLGAVAATEFFGRLSAPPPASIALTGVSQSDGSPRAAGAADAAVAVLAALGSVEAGAVPVIAAAAPSPVEPVVVSAGTTPRAVAAPAELAVLNWTVQASLEEVAAPVDAPGAGPAGVSGPAPVANGQLAAPDAAPFDLSLRQASDAYFAASTPAPAAPAPGDSEGGDGSASLLAAAALGLGLIGRWGAPRLEEKLRRRLGLDRGGAGA